MLLRDLRRRSRRGKSLELNSQGNVVLQHGLSAPIQRFGLSWAGVEDSMASSGMTCASR